VPHPHVHTPHELTERPARERPPRAERVLELLAVLLLSATTVATAWSGYQAARWSGEQSSDYAKASATRVRAEQQATAAGQVRIDDLLRFDGYLDARAAGRRELAAQYKRRFRPGFVPAFEAWSKHPDAYPSPLYEPSYRPVEVVRAAALNRQADALFQSGSVAKDHDDRYILSTVFFAGISLRLDWRPLRVVVLALSTAMLIGGAIIVLGLPVA
jgi:hypothetical protein